MLRGCLCCTLCTAQRLKTVLSAYNLAACACVLPAAFVHRCAAVEAGRGI